MHICSSLSSCASYCFLHRSNGDAVCSHRRGARCAVSAWAVAQPVQLHTAVVPDMLIVWPLAAWVAALKLWPALPPSPPPTVLAQSARQHSPPPTGLLEHHLLKDKPLSLKFFISSLRPIFHCLCVSPSLCLSIHHGQLLSQLQRFPVSEVKEVSHSKEEPAALFHITPYREL